MLRVGVDLVSVARIKEAVTRTPHLADRVYSTEELAYCRNRANPYPSMAARFAAREALRKLHPVFIQVCYQDVAVEIEDSGRPRYRFSSSLQQKARAAGLISIDLSLSHDGDQAVAVAVAEWKEDEIEQ
ncbi:MAG: holo-ACP synthase [Methylocystaceae bacterium]